MMIQAPKSSRMHAVSLFSGIGLLDLGLHRAGIETRIFCESDRAARGFLARRFPGIPIHPDVQELTADDLAAATGALVDAGYDVSSPHEIVITKPHGEPTWHDYMRAAVRMLTHCDAIAVLPGWEKSRGALVEIDLARALDMPVLAVADLVEQYHSSKP